MTQKPTTHRNAAHIVKTRLDDEEHADFLRTIGDLRHEPIGVYP